MRAAYHIDATLNSGRAYVNPIAEGRSAGALEVGIGSVPQNSHLVPNYCYPTWFNAYAGSPIFIPKSEMLLLFTAATPVYGGRGAFQSHKKMSERVASLSQIKGQGDTSLVHWLDERRNQFMPKRRLGELEGRSGISIGVHHNYLFKICPLFWACIFNQNMLCLTAVNVKHRYHYFQSNTWKGNLLNRHTVTNFFVHLSNRIKQVQHFLNSMLVITSSKFCLLPFHASSSGFSFYDHLA